MKRATRSKFSGIELKETAKAGNLAGLKEVWATYLEGDVSEKYKEALGLLSIAITQKDDALFYWVAGELEALDHKWNNLPNALKEGKTPPSRLRTLDGAIHMACKQQQPAYLKRLLELGFEANHPDRENDLPIHVACKGGSIEVLQLLLSLPTIQVDKPDLDGDTPMILAIQYKHSALLEPLKIRGADVNKTGKHGYTPLMVAIMQSDSEAITTLLRMGAEIHQATHRGVTTLGVASGVNNIAMMQLMLSEAETDVNAVDENNATALMAACTFGHLDAAQLLLDHGADINIQTKVGSTAFWHACEVGHEPVVQLLAERGADISLPNKAGVSPLMAAAMGGHKEVVKLLISYGVDVNARETTNAKTSLHEASGRGHASVVKSLLRAGAEVDCRDHQWGSTPLQYASKQGHADVVSLLLEHGADINKPNSDGMTPVISAAEHNRIEALDVLLNWEGVRVDHVDKDGDTALLRASLHGYPATVELLLMHGASPTRVNKRGKTPMLLVQDDLVKKRQNYMRCEQILHECISGKMKKAKKKDKSKATAKANEIKQKSVEREPAGGQRAPCSGLPPLSHSKQPHAPPQHPHPHAHAPRADLPPVKGGVKTDVGDGSDLSPGVVGGLKTVRVSQSLDKVEEHFKMEPKGSMARNGMVSPRRQAKNNANACSGRNSNTQGAATGASDADPSSNGGATTKNARSTPQAAQGPELQPPLQHGVAHAAIKPEEPGQTTAEPMGGVQGPGSRSMHSENGGGSAGGHQGGGGMGGVCEGGDKQTRGVKRQASPDEEANPGDSKRRKLARLLEVSEAMNARTAELNFVKAEQERVSSELARLQAAQVQLQERRTVMQADVTSLKADYDELFVQIGLL